LISPFLSESDENSLSEESEWKTMSESNIHRFLDFYKDKSKEYQKLHATLSDKNQRFQAQKKQVDYHHKIKKWTERLDIRAR
jgi:hypothetical protein